ncbi:MAG: DUF4270 family protein [Bacteroidota bacterium]
MNRILSYLPLLALLILTACTDPITVGSDLVDGDLADIGQTSDIPFTTRVVPEDSIIVYDESENAIIGSFTFGRTNDVVAGNWDHSLYIVPRLVQRTSTGLPDPPEFAFRDDINVDSAVLILEIDTSSAFFGLARTFPTSVTALTDMVDQGVDYYSNVEFPASGPMLNRDAFFSATREETLLYDTIVSPTGTTSGDTVSQAHIRIALNDNFLTQLNMLDESAFESDTTFWDFLPGLAITPSEVTNALVTLRARPARIGSAARAGLYFFFPDTATGNPTFYQTPIDLALPRYQKDFTGSLTETLLGEEEDNEQVVVSGQSGVMTEITFTDLSALTDVVINQAEIKFYLEDVDGYDYDEFANPTFFALYYRDETGALQPIEDRINLANPSSSDAVRQFLGGDPQTDDDGNVFYQPKFSIHMQSILEGSVPPTIYLRVVPVDSDPSRAVLAGPQAAVRPASVQVTFTELN